MKLPILGTEAIASALASLDGWDLIDGKLARGFMFVDFQAAFAFMTSVARTAERLGHHPDWRNVWNRVDIALSTHDAGGITQADVDLAREIDRVFRQDASD